MQEARFGRNFLTVLKIRLIQAIKPSTNNLPKRCWSDLKEALEPKFTRILSHVLYSHCPTIAFTKAEVCNAVEGNKTMFGEGSKSGL